MSSWEGALGAGTVMRDVSIELGFGVRLRDRGERSSVRRGQGGQRFDRGLKETLRERQSIREAFPADLWLIFI
jgi:hypothetical protein